MRFAVAHKTATYLMVAFAYLAMTTGGALSPALSFGGLMALGASWWWEPPRIRYEKWSLFWTIISVFALVYAVLTAIVTGDFLGVGGQFLMFLIVSKSYNRRTLRDWQQMYLLAFLMVVAGSVLNPDLVYGMCFLGFVVSTTWAMTLFHLRREMEDNLLVKHASADKPGDRVEVRRILDSKRIVNGRFFLGTGMLSFAVFLGAAAVFLALPRVGIGFFLKSRGGLTLAGFSDGVKLGGHGVIKDDPTIVMRVDIDKKYGGREAPEIHWRGVAFDNYLKGSWTRTKNAPETVSRLEENRTVDRRSLAWAGQPKNVANIDLAAELGVKQDIWLEPLDSDVLFGAGLPQIVEYEHVLRPRKYPIEHNDEIRLTHGNTVHYTVWSELKPPPVEALRAAPTTPMPRSFGVYLELGDEITPRTRALALKITAGQTNNYDKAMAIDRWLKNNLTYTLELADPGSQEAVDFFLFDRKKGHCEYFASAFAVLAREAGIPVRNVNGFLGGEWNEYQGYVAVRAGDAHSWDEVYFPGQGWVMFDPTPPADIDQLGRGGTGWRAKLSRIIDTLKFQWTKWVIEYDLASQLALFKSIGGAIKDGILAGKRALLHVKDLALEHWPVTLVVIALPTGLWIRRRRRRGPREAMTSSGKTVRRTRSTVADVYDSVAKALAKAGLPRHMGTTPRELAIRMTERGDPGADAVGELTELYYAAEWGGRRDPAAEERAAVLAREIRAALDAARKARR